MTIVYNRPGPAPGEIARIARRMGGTRNEVNETESTLIPSNSTPSGIVSNAPASTGKLGETVDDGTVLQPQGTATPNAHLTHAQSIAGGLKDPNMPVAGRPVTAHKVTTAVAPGNAALAQNTQSPASPANTAGKPAFDTLSAHQTHPQHPAGVAGTETKPEFSRAADNSKVNPLD